ncbi:MAG: hypothetical protein ACI4SG_08675, partial [Oligosphaeraceae bacterium]
MDGNESILLHKSFFETKKGRFDNLPSVKLPLMDGEPIISPNANASAAGHLSGPNSNGRSISLDGQFSISDAVKAKERVDDLLEGRISRKDGAKIDYRIQGESMETISRDARRVIDEFSHKRIPLSTGKELYFSPDRRTIDAYGGDMAAAWAEYALHLVTHRGKTKDGKVVRFFDEKNISAILPNIQDIVNEDRVIRLDNWRIAFYGKYTKGDSARNSRYAKLVTEMDASGDLACDLRYITGMLRKGTLPDNAVTLREAVAKSNAIGRAPANATGSNVTPVKQFSITSVAVNQADDENRGTRFSISDAVKAKERVDDLLEG